MSKILVPEPRGLTFWLKLELVLWNTPKVYLKMCQWLWWLSYCLYFVLKHVTDDNISTTVNKNKVFVLFYQLTYNNFTYYKAINVVQWNQASRTTWPSYTWRDIGSRRATFSILNNCKLRFLANTSSGYRVCYLLSTGIIEEG